MKIEVCKDSYVNIGICMDLSEKKCLNFVYDSSKSIYEVWSNEGLKKELIEPEAFNSFFEIIQERII